MRQQRKATKAVSPRITQTPRILFQPGAYKAMQTGINLIAEAVRPTLEPLPRFVAMDKSGRTDKAPELLDDGGIIVRRMVALPDKDADMGAMFLRQVLWKHREEAGDGTATTAVLFQNLYNEGIKYIVAGGNPMPLRHSLERGLCVIRDQLARMVKPLEGRAQIAALAESVAKEAPMATALGDIFDVIGEHGLLEVRSDYGHDIRREFVQGAYFKGRLHSKLMVTDTITSKTQLENAAIFVSDRAIEDSSRLVSLLNSLYTGGVKSLVIVAKSLSEQAIALLLTVSRDPQKFHVIAVKAASRVRVCVRTALS
jgi:chaperonin GroEL